LSRNPPPRPYDFQHTNYAVELATIKIWISANSLKPSAIDEIDPPMPQDRRSGYAEKSFIKSTVPVLHEAAKELGVQLVAAAD